MMDLNYIFQIKSLMDSAFLYAFYFLFHFTRTCQGKIVTLFLISLRHIRLFNFFKFKLNRLNFSTIFSFYQLSKTKQSNFACLSKYPEFLLLRIPYHCKYYLKCIEFQGFKTLLVPLIWLKFEKFGTHEIKLILWTQTITLNTYQFFHINWNYILRVQSR